MEKFKLYSNRCIRLAALSAVLNAELSAALSAELNAELSAAQNVSALQNCLASFPKKLEVRNTLLK